MSEVSQIDQNKQKSTPVDSAVGKIKETIGREIQKKIDEKVKAAMDAQRLYKTLVIDIKALVKESEADKNDVAEFLRELK